MRGSVYSILWGIFTVKTRICVCTNQICIHFSNDVISNQHSV